jgi:phosphoglycolate phosphatase
MKQRKAVIFDLDGTLLNTLEDIADSLNHELARHGMRQRTLSEVRGFVGDGARKLFERAVDGGAENPDFEELFSEFSAYYKDHAAIKTAPYPYIVELLDILSYKGVLCAVVSNKPDAAARIACQKYFGDKLSLVLGNREGIRLKPHPDALVDVVTKLGVERAVYVGDSEVDVMTAKAANMPCISVTWGFRDEDVLRAAGADCLAHSARELYGKIHELLELDGSPDDFVFGEK